MAKFYSKTGKLEIIPTQKKTYQGQSKNTKFAKKSNSCGVKKYRGQGR